MSDDYMKAKGYVIHDFTSPCTSHKYEGEKLRDLMQKYFEDLPHLVEQGLDKKYLDFNYLLVDLASEAE